MSDNERPVRRVGQDTRKDRIEVTGDLFPREEDDAPLPPMPLPFGDGEDVAFLQSLPSGLVSRALKVTPHEERFPPLAPAPAEDTAPMRPTTRQPATPAKARPARNGLYNVIALVAWVSLCAVATAFTLIWSNPYTLLNPFPPPIVYVYVTATPLSAPPPTFAPSDAPASLFPFVAESPVLYTSNSNGRECAWASIAGTVRDKEGRALNGYRVRITDAQGNTETVFSGATATFGDGGFEFPLGEAPREGVFTLQVASPQGTPLTDFMTLVTRADCTANVAVINFVEN